MTSLDLLLADHPLPDLAGGKDESGTVVVIGGPPTCPGAAMLAGIAALRIGSGRVQLVTHPAVAPAVAVAFPEAWVGSWDQSSPVPDDIARPLRSADVVIIGPGHRRLATDLVATIVQGAEGAAIVLDAGALPAAPELIGSANLVLAPNTAEARDLAEVDGDETSLALELGARFGRPVAVRGQTTAIADAGGQHWRFDDAPPGLGTPGSGDVLMGALGGLLAAGVPPVAALGWAVRLHAKAGALLAKATPAGYLAREIAAMLPTALGCDVATSGR